MSKIEDIINPYKQTNLTPQAGRLLIAAPYLSDPNFARTVILICEHNSEGSVGFILNRSLGATLNEVVEEVYTQQYEIFEGGPVGNDTLHVLHKKVGALGGKALNENTFWGASYSALIDLLNKESIPNGSIKLLSGYAGWSYGQLEEEVKEGSWLVGAFNESIIFESKCQNIWANAIISLGQEFAYLSKIPLHPQMN